MTREEAPFRHHAHALGERLDLPCAQVHLHHQTHHSRPPRFEDDRLPGQSCRDRAAARLDLHRRPLRVRQLHQTDRQHQSFAGPHRRRQREARRPWQPGLELVARRLDRTVAPEADRHRRVAPSLRRQLPGSIRADPADGRTERREARFVILTVHRFGERAPPVDPGPLGEARLGGLDLEDRGERFDRRPPEGDAAQTRQEHVLAHGVRVDAGAREDPREGIDHVVAAADATVGTRAHQLPAGHGRQEREACTPARCPAQDERRPPAIEEMPAHRPLVLEAGRPVEERRQVLTRITETCPGLVEAVTLDELAQHHVDAPQSLAGDPPRHVVEGEGPIHLGQGVDVERLAIEPCHHLFVEPGVLGGREEDGVVEAPAPTLAHAHLFNLVGNLHVSVVLDGAHEATQAPTDEARARAPRVSE